jgi:predicted RNase H-like HicB family nuclease
VEIDVVIHRDSETASYWAESPQLPGCHAVGKTLEELYESLQEAVQLYLENGEHPDLLLSDRIHAIERYEVDREGFMHPPASASYTLLNSQTYMPHEPVARLPAGLLRK